MTRLLIIADDFTGALDTGVQLAKRGVDTRVAVMRQNPDNASEPSLDGLGLEGPAQVLVVNTESRHIPPEAAYARVAALVLAAAHAGFTHFYKKTDSTLRGNIGAELDALLVSTAAEELVFVPAFPKLERYTIGGLQYVGKTLLSETPFASDPFNPISQSDVAELVREQTDLPVENVYLGEFGKLAQPAELNAADSVAAQANPNPRTIRVVDARSDDDMMQIGRVLKESGDLAVLAGCAGFAELLPDLLELPTELVKPPHQPGAVLLVSGSVNPLSVRQVRHAIEHEGYASSRLTVEQKIDSTARADAWEELLAEQLVKQGRAVIWSQRSDTTADDAEQRAQSLGIDTRSLSGLIAGNIGAIVQRALERSDVGTLIVFGGDTLLGIADAIDCHRMRPITEIMPGVALAHFDDDRYPQNVITKAGGFGGEDVIEGIDQFLAQLDDGGTNRDAQ